MPRRVDVNNLNNIGQARIRKGLERKEIAKMIGVSVQSIAQYESKLSPKMPSLVTAEKLSKLYNCTINDLL